MEYSFLNEKCDMKVSNVLIFILGIFSTFQFIQILQINVFTYMLLATGLLKIFKGKIKIYDKLFVLLLISLTVTEIGNRITFDWKLSNNNEWQSRSLMRYIIYIGIFLTYTYITDGGIKKIKIFLRGVYISCFIQLVWGYLQFAAYHLFGILINEKIIGGVLRNWTIASTQFTVQGKFIINSINSNAGILAGELAFFYCFSKTVWLKIASLGLMILTGNTTNMVLAVTCVFIELLMFFRKRIAKVRKRFLIALLSTAVLVAIILVSNKGIVDRVTESVVRHIDRFSAALGVGGTRIDGSTFTHKRYYTALPYIYSHSSLLRVLFGYGLACGGVPFVRLFNQYPDIVYSTESDITSNLYGIGLVGFMIYINLFIRFLRIRSRDKTHIEPYIKMIVLFLVGSIFYSIHMDWLILTVLVSYKLLKSEIVTLDNVNISIPIMQEN